MNPHQQNKVDVSYLELVLKQVFLVGELAVKTEEFGLLLRHFLFDFVSCRRSQRLLRRPEPFFQGPRKLRRGLP